jgi:hypothetical protein
MKYSLHILTVFLIVIISCKKENSAPYLEGVSGSKIQLETTEGNSFGEIARFKIADPENHTVQESHSTSNGVSAKRESDEIVFSLEKNYTSKDIGTHEVGSVTLTDDPDKKYKGSESISYSIELLVLEKTNATLVSLLFKKKAFQFKKIQQAELLEILTLKILTVRLFLLK